jgi:hypothetical protein
MLVATVETPCLAAATAPPAVPHLAFPTLAPSVNESYH